jgi:hypothetical protein
MTAKSKLSRVILASYRRRHRATPKEQIRRILLVLRQTAATLLAIPVEQRGPYFPFSTEAEAARYDRLADRIGDDELEAFNFRLLFELI